MAILPVARNGGVELRSRLFAWQIEGARVFKTTKIIALGFKHLFHLSVAKWPTETLRNTKLSETRKSQNVIKNKYESTVKKLHCRDTLLLFKDNHLRKKWPDPVFDYLPFFFFRHVVDTYLTFFRSSCGGCVF